MSFNSGYWVKYGCNSNLQNLGLDANIGEDVDEQSTGDIVEYDKVNKCVAAKGGRNECECVGTRVKMRPVQGRNNDKLSKRASGHESEGAVRVTTAVYKKRLG